MDAKTSAAPTSSAAFVRVKTTMSSDAAWTSAFASAISSRNEKATIRNTTIATGPPRAGDSGRGSVEEQTAPGLQHDQRPDPGAVIAPARRMVTQHARQRVLAEIAAREAPPVEQDLLREGPERLPEPEIFRNAEALLGLRQRGGGQQPFADSPKQILAQRPAQLEGDGQGRHVLHQRVVEQGRPHLQ